MRSSALFFGLSLLGSALADIPAIESKGNKLFYSNNGTQFYIRGVAYQQEYSGDDAGSTNVKYNDPLADPKKCERDIPYLKELRTNVIRTYALNPEADHDKCMSMLADAGIYLISDLSQPDMSINRNNPSWDIELYDRYTSVIDTFSKYNNVIGFFAGNEVSNRANNTNSLAYVKAAIRDMKQYIKDNNYRKSLMIGYSTNDDKEIRENLADYINCGNEQERADMFGYNIYEWCGDSSFHQSGYDDRTKAFENYSIPAFFSEYGCNDVEPREFTNVPVLFGPKMNDVWSGGIIYMYFQEDNDYGLVSIKNDKVKTLSDFENLSSQMKKVSPTGVKENKFSPTNSPASCPTTGDDWLASDTLPPTPDEDLCDCMMDSLSCVASEDISDKKVGNLFGTVCGFDVCTGISGNATSGDYGAYSMCKPRQQLSFAMNRYYQQQKSKGHGAKACDFNGAATTQSSSQPTGQCAKKLKQAGKNGQGTMTGSHGAGSTGGSGDGSTSSGAAAPGISSPVNAGMWQVGMYAGCAVIAGVGMIWL